MKIFFEGTTHLAHYSIVGASARGLHVVMRSEEADLIAIAHDTPTDANGNRNLDIIDSLIETYRGNKPVLLMSQVPPGFCRAKAMPNLFYYPETLRIKDSYQRAVTPEYIIIGHLDDEEIPMEIIDYTSSFSCRLLIMTYEEAEFSKIAVNMALASQVDYANRMADACTKIGANWDKIREAVSLDKRIGTNAYLTPGRWQDSIHLLRDYVTLKEIEDANN